MSDEDAARARAELARNVADARHKAGMTQTELAEAAGLAQQKVSRIEGGIENVTLRTLARLARALRTEIACLFRKK